MKTMEWIDFAAIKDVVSLRMVLDHYGIKLRPSGPNRLRGRCPLPSHNSKESKESFIVSLDRGVGGAWSCHSNSCAAARGGKLGGNALDLVAALEQCSLRDAAIKLQNVFLVPSASKDRPARTEPPKETLPGDEPVSEKTDEPEANKPLGFELQKIDYAHPYLGERGIMEETAIKFGVGYFSGKGSMHARIVLPIHNPHGELVAYAGRSIDGSEPRYKFPAGFRKSLELYNLHRLQGELATVIVEGFFDTMRISRAGYPCIGLMGSTMSEVQENLIAEHFGSVVIMLDGDEAGRKGTDDIVDRLCCRVFSVKTVELDIGLQPDQLTVVEIDRELGDLIGRLASWNAS